MVRRSEPPSSSPQELWVPSSSPQKWPPPYSSLQETLEEWTPTSSPTNYYEKGSDSPIDGLTGKQFILLLLGLTWLPTFLGIVWYCCGGPGFESVDDVTAEPEDIKPGKAEETASALRETSDSFIFNAENDNPVDAGTYPTLL